MASPHETATKISSDVDRFFRYVFTSINVEGPSLNAEEIQHNPHMIVSTHRSHVDYFMAGWVLYYRGFKHMRFAAGSNLTGLPWIGPRFRALGAFTVEREIAFERNYVKNLCNQVIGMMEKREAVVLFPEGGRSYSGAMLEIKSGILGAAVLLQARRPQEDVHLIPMALSYECPPDAPWFELLLKGKTLRRRGNNAFNRLRGSVYYFGADVLAFLPFITARRTRRRYGAVYVDYGAPVSVRSLVDLAFLRTADVKDEFFSHRAAMQKVSTIMQDRFLSLYRLLPMHVVAALITANGPISAAQSVALIPGLVEQLHNSKRNLKSLRSYSPHDLIVAGKEQLLRLGAITFSGGIMFEKNGPLLRYCAAPVFDGAAKGS
jgi:1-acyl-sn-glycerol-3-phosphate acyltransferase